MSPMTNLKCMERYFEAGPKKSTMTFGGAVQHARVAAAVLASHSSGGSFARAASIGAAEQDSETA